MSIATCLRTNAGRWHRRQVSRHVQRCTRLLDQANRIGPNDRRVPTGMRGLRALLAQALSHRVEFGPRRARRKCRTAPGLGFSLLLA